MAPCRASAASASSNWVVQMQDSWINHELINNDAKCAQSLVSICYAVTSLHTLSLFSRLGINLHRR